MNKLNLNLLVFLLVLVLPLHAFADSELEKDMSMYLATIVDTLEQPQLTPMQLKQFAEKQVVARWDVASSMLGMLGRSRWQQLSDSQQAKLSDSFKQTLVRYFLEAYQYYDGQTLGLQSIKLNKKATKGWVGVLIESPILPDFNVDFGLVKRDAEWRFRDLRIQGISYLSLKRGYYQGTLEQKGFDQLVAELDAKNRSFFASLSTPSTSAE